MRLTNHMRAAFVRGVMNDVPNVDYSEQIRKLALEAVVRALPLDIRRAYMDEKQHEYLNWTYRSWGGVSVRVPGVAKWNDALSLPVLSTPDNMELEGLAALQKAQIAKLDKLRSKLKEAAYAATTRKQLAELLPEFEKYLPEDEGTALRTVPVVANLVADFVDAGWPATTQKTGA